MNKPLSIIDIILSSIVNVSLLPWTAIVLFEQMFSNTKGTSLEILVILPWIVQFCLIPIMIFNIVVTVINIAKYNLKHNIQIIELVFTFMGIAQIILFNLLITI